ncbi:hypothetical protein V6N13_016178 [Hibiscus sabdariffa]
MSLPLLCNPNPTPNGFFTLTFGAVRRGFSDEVMGSFLDKSKIVEKSKESEAIWRIDALREVLKEIHSLFVMFHGSIRALLEREPNEGLTRAHLYPFIMDYLRVTNCQHVKSGLPWISAAVVMLKLLYQMALSGFVLPSFAEVAT